MGSPLSKIGQPVILKKLGGRCICAALTLVSLSVRADEPILPIAFGLGLPFMAALSTAGGAFLVISLIEAAVLRRLMAWPWGESLKSSFFANLFSTLVGLVVMAASSSGEAYLLGCLVGAVFFMRLIPRLHAGSGRFGWLRRHLWLGGIGTGLLLLALAIVTPKIQDAIGGVTGVMLLPAGFGISVLTEAWVLYRRHPDAGVKLLRAAVWMNGASYAVLLAALFLPGIKPINQLMRLTDSGDSRRAQKRTMADMKMLSTAIEAYNTDSNHYPVAGNMDELCKILVPEYMTTCIRHDGWSTRLKPRDFAYLSWEETSADCKNPSSAPVRPGIPPPNPKASHCEPSSEFVLASAGKDGVYEHQDLRQYQRRDTCTYNNDIVIRNGEFLQLPGRAQSDEPDTHLPCAMY